MQSMRPWAALSYGGFQRRIAMADHESNGNTVVFQLKSLQQMLRKAQESLLGECASAVVFWACLHLCVCAVMALSTLALKSETLSYRWYNALQRWG